VFILALIFREVLDHSPGAGCENLRGRVMGKPIGQKGMHCLMCQGVEEFLQAENLQALYLS
jgi:hypothetical protein